MRGHTSLACAWVLAFGCEGASPDPGLEALLQVEGAQFRPGEFPADEGGPAAVALTTRHTHLVVGRLGEQLRAALEPAAHAAAIGIEGASGAWLVPAGVPDFDSPDLPTARATFGVSDAFPAGPFVLMLAAADELGRFGAAATAMVVADVEPPPAGKLVVQLAWEGPADLDLHVVEPGGGEAWSEKPNTMPVPPPGVPVDPNEFKRHGILDHDGNASCRRDGRPAEAVIWTDRDGVIVTPPSGEYVVRVDARSMCGAPVAAWYVAAYRGDELISAARGVSTPEDVLHPHGAGAGVLALRFSL